MASLEIFFIVLWLVFSCPYMNCRYASRSVWHVFSILISDEQLSLLTAASLGNFQWAQTVTTIMPSIPVDVLREILEHVSEADLVTLCQVNKICCSCSQDVLYRNVKAHDSHVTQILAQSTELAKRVRLYENYYPHSLGELSMALKNMSSLRHLDLLKVYDATILDGCTFQLDTFRCPFYYSEPLRKFLASQPSLSYVQFLSGLDVSIPFEQTSLPNLTRINASHKWLPRLIPGRPVRSIVTFKPDFTYGPVDADFDSSFFALSTGPLQKLIIPFFFLYPKPASLLISTFPSLMHLVLTSGPRYSEVSAIVRKTSFY
jgi:F-box domain